MFGTEISYRYIIRCFSVPNEIMYVLHLRNFHLHFSWLLLVSFSWKQEMSNFTERKYYSLRRNVAYFNRKRNPYQLTDKIIHPF
jgi:hypothetical protein